MKKGVHPKYYPSAKVTCACGNTFTTGSTIEELSTELCSKCHPFFTKKQKLVDTAKRVDKFKQKLEKVVEAAKTHKGKKIKHAERAVKKSTKKKTISIKDIETANTKK